MKWFVWCVIVYVLWMTIKRVWNDFKRDGMKKTVERVMEAKAARKPERVVKAKVVRKPERERAMDFMGANTGPQKSDSLFQGFWDEAEKERNRRNEEDGFGR